MGFLAHTRRDFCRAVACWILGADRALPATLENEPAMLEYRVKAAYLYNFAKFVSWPEASSDRSPFVLGVLGKDPFGPVLDETVQGKTLFGRPVAVRRFSQIGQVSACPVLFVSSSERRRLAEHLRAPELAGVLTVGEGKEFLAAGGVISFYQEGNKVHFEINAEATKRSGLRLNAQLLKLGRGGKE